VLNEKLENNEGKYSENELRLEEEIHAIKNKFDIML
jgi:hypothetical protein